MVNVPYSKPHYSLCPVYDDHTDAGCILYETESWSAACRVAQDRAVRSQAYDVAIIRDGLIVGVARRLNGGSVEV